MKFFKYHALGNDYLVIDPEDWPSPLTPLQIKVICHRNFGVGSDGILLGPLPSEEARYFEEGSVRVHHIHADSIFDFRPRRALIGTEVRKFRASALDEWMRSQLKFSGHPCPVKGAE